MDYKKVQDKYGDSLSQFDLKRILENNDHWTLNFSSLQNSVHEMVTTIYELELSDYRNNLPRWVSNEIDSFRANIINYIILIKDFSIEQSNASEIRINYINQLNTLYNSNFYRIEEILNNLKIKKLLQDKSWLNEQINSLWELEKMTLALEKAKIALEKKTTEITSATNLWNETGNLESSYFFETQANIHSEKMTEYLRKRTRFYWALIFWAIISWAIYLLIRPISNLSDGIELWVFAVMWFALLYFWFSFSTNNYYIERWLEIENLHRKNIANTAPKLQLWASSDIAKELIITEEVKALFAPIWSKIEGKWTEITTPLIEVIHSLIKK